MGTGKTYDPQPAAVSGVVVQAKRQQGDTIIRRKVGTTALQNTPCLRIILHRISVQIVCLFHIRFEGSVPDIIVSEKPFFIYLKVFCFVFFPLANVQSCARHIACCTFYHDAVPAAEGRKSLCIVFARSRSVIGTLGRTR